MQPVGIRDFSIGSGRPVLILGPCVIETRDLTLRIAERVRKIAGDLQCPIIFKASFDKANRTSGESFRGLGLGKGLEILRDVRDTFDVPVTTDIHESSQAGEAAAVCELLQIPAFLARQTDLLAAAAETGRPLNVKKGQFMSPEDMTHVVRKVRSMGGCLCLCERGTFFGYGRLVNDMQSLPIMRSLSVPVIFDATHSVQNPGGLGGKTGGNRAMVEPLARAAAAVGVDGFFFETHPDPDSSPSDGPNMVPLEELPGVITRVLAVWETVHGFNP